MPTIGVSIAVPDPLGARLQQYRIDAGDEAAHHIPTHVTVLPPYDIERHLLAEVYAHLARAAVRIEPYKIRLRGTGSFRPISPVVFLNVVEGISECELLTASVVAGPLVPDLRFPYHPHVTIAHDLSEEELDRAFEEWADVDVSFTVSAFHLYEFDSETGWEPTRTFEFGFGERR
ncbi:MAG: 2'-5' RNA ligase family protein [Marmoricola sp.]